MEHLSFVFISCGRLSQFNALALFPIFLRHVPFSTDDEHQFLLTDIRNVKNLGEIFVNFFLLFFLFYSRVIYKVKSSFLLGCSRGGEGEGGRGLRHVHSHIYSGTKDSCIL